MCAYVLGFREIDKAKANLVGGKGANLGEIFKIEGINVPDGFCISTEAFNRIISATPSIGELIDQLSLLNLKQPDEARETSREIRRIIESMAIPEDVSEEILQHLARLGETSAYAVRSSATAEDLPTASFAGQQDTYLNVIGKEEILKHISRCWASLFTERAVIYRLQNGFDHRKVKLSVVVQKMVFPKVSGILFTADPVTGNRKISCIDASFGLGEALVSGRINADNYRVRNGVIIEKKTAYKTLASYALKDGGTAERDIDGQRQNEQALTDEQILALERMGRRIEHHFGHPQDIEWCFSDGALSELADAFHVVQSRPITTLFPIPKASDDGNHVYVSVGHQQMMTDPIKPLGLSFFLLTTRAPMRVAGGRLFVDVTDGLASPVTRQNLLDVIGQSEPLIKDALATIVDRGDFINPLSHDGKEFHAVKSNKGMSAAEIQAQAGNDPAIVIELMRRTEVSLDELRKKIETKSGSALFDFILADIHELKRLLFDPQSFAVFKSAMDASAWINDHINEWLGEKNAADALSQSVPNNITSEMGLAMLDVADVIRPFPQVIDFLEHTSDDHFLDELVRLDGGLEASNAIRDFLSKYGMRCSGEIDITKDRWSEKPISLVPLIISNMKNFQQGESKRRFERGRKEALKKEQALLELLRQLPDGEQKVRDTREMISLVRNFIGYREYPKYGMVNRYFIYKQALLKEAEKLVEAKLIRETQDIFYLTFEELREVVHSKKLDYEIIQKRIDEYTLYARLTPPRVITSDGEIIAGQYKREDIPNGAIPGLAVSSGVVEGRARVILSMEDAELEEGDILVTRFTDPGWTALFVSIKGLITEVGGLMTHGAVVAREYGLPAVVGVQDATTLIKDGQRIRVHGTEGYVEIL